MPESVDLGLEPYEHQRIAHAAMASHRFGVLVWHRRAGKTVFSCLELFLRAVRCQRPRPNFGYVAPFYRQAKDVAWPYLTDWARKVPRAKVNRSELSITFAHNGAKIALYGSDNPDSLRGRYYDGVVMDEVGDMRPETWTEVVRPALADRKGWALFIGTPKGVNLFSQVYEKAKTLDGWFDDLRTVYDTNVIPSDEIEEIRAAMSEAEFSQEFLCDFGAANNMALLQPTEVYEAMNRAPKAIEDYEYAPRVVGVDVARYGDAQTVIALRQGPVCYPFIRGHGAGVVEVANAVASVHRQWDPDGVFVDEGGVGGGVVDLLREYGIPVYGVNFGEAAQDKRRYHNRRVEMWHRMAEWVRKEGCLPSGDTTVVTELCSPRYSYDARGRMKLESKDALRARGLASPDTADALALTFASMVPSKRARRAIGVDSLQGTARTDYNALEPWQRRSGMFGR